MLVCRSLAKIGIGIRVRGKSRFAYLWDGKAHINKGADRRLNCRAQNQIFKGSCDALRDPKSEVPPAKLLGVGPGVGGGAVRTACLSRTEASRWTRRLL
jgi:hypothetical protein